VSLDDRVLECLEADGDWMSASEVAEKIGISAARAAQALWRLKIRNRVKNAWLEPPYKAGSRFKANPR